MKHYINRRRIYGEIFTALFSTNANSIRNHNELKLKQKNLYLLYLKNIRFSE